MLVSPAMAAIGSDSSSADRLPRFEARTECFIEPPADLDVSLDMDCGTVAVPEFHHGDGEATGKAHIKLAVMRLHARQDSGQTPLFMLAGGPGASLIKPDTLRLFQPGLLGGVLATRDVIIMDQRGAGHSQPLLDCPTIHALDWTARQRKLNAEEADALGHEAIQQCIDGFRAQGVDFDAYNSVENAADVNAVREALGYPRMVYYGVSYGAQLGQHLMRDFPVMLEAVVLDGANSLSRNSWVEDRALDVQWGVDKLVALCDADAKCRETYDIPMLIERALALFDAGPLLYRYTDPKDPSSTIEFEISRDDMIDKIYAMQSSRISSFSLPAILTILTQGDADTARNTTAEGLGEEMGPKLAASRDPHAGAMAFLMHAAMVCSDDPVRSVDEVQLQGVGEYAKQSALIHARFYVQLCQQIDVKSLPDSTDVDVGVDIPTLLLSGDLDVATPAFRSQIVADALPNATHIVFPGRTHVQISGINQCGAQIATAFILDPTAALDQGCVRDTPTLSFVLPDGSMSK